MARHTISIEIEIDAADESAALQAADFLGTEINEIIRNSDGDEGDFEFGNYEVTLGDPL